MAAIDVGEISWSRYAGAGQTRVTPSNPANLSGLITAVTISCFNHAHNTKAGLWSASGNTLTCRDYEVLGDVGTGTYSGLSITCVAGDYIGAYHDPVSNYYIGNESLDYGWKKDGDHTADGAQDFGATQLYLCISISGTGTDVVAGWSNIAKALGVASADMSKILGVAVADVSKLDGASV